jgi:hypothetical protein
MTRRARAREVDLSLVTIRYLGDYYEYPDGDAGPAVSGRGDTVRVRLAGHWAALVEAGHAEVLSE